jgi:hypothetical protein
MRYLPVSVGDSDWIAAGEDDDPGSRLVSEVTPTINGIPMHLEAIAVRDERGTQVADNEADTEALDRLFVAFGPDGAWLPTEINGRSYALFLEPHTQ